MNKLTPLFFASCAFIAVNSLPSHASNLTSKFKIEVEQPTFIESNETSDFVDDDCDSCKI